MISTLDLSRYIVLLGCLQVCGATAAGAGIPEAFLKVHCVTCHSGETPSAALDLETLSHEPSDPETLRRWIKVHDRIASGEMPPREADQPNEQERRSAVSGLSQAIVAAEQSVGSSIPRLRRLTRTEYENTIRDLFDMPGIALAGNLPADGSAHGFNKHPDALDISHVNIAKYLEAADHILDYAIATRPDPPTISTRRISLVNRGGFVAHIVMNGDGILLKNRQPDPDFPPAAEQNHLDQGAHERWGSFRNGASVGLFRHEDESVSPYFIEHVTIYPARYRLRTSLWSFQWDRGRMLPGRGTEAARLSVVQLTGDGRGGQHPSYVLGYFDAPREGSLEHELYVWLNHNELIGFNTASLAPVANYYKKQRAMEFTGPGITVDWMDIEGPLYEQWPPLSHRRLFGQLPMTEFKVGEQPNIRAPRRVRPRQIGAGMNRPDPEPGIWSVQSESALEDAERLLDGFLPLLFRRPVPPEVRQQYVDIVNERLEAGDCFELAMRAAYRNALVSPDFLLHVEPPGVPDDFALACRLSYFLWNSLPDEELNRLASSGALRKPEVFHGQVERLLLDQRSQRFMDDFLGQWLRLNEIAATDPDRKLYPEFSPYLQDSMVAETRAYFRELLERDLDVSHLVRSDFIMINQKLAKHYGIDGVDGTQIRRVPLPETCPRGGFVTQASILKITANGTTTSPVPRGAFVIDRLLGEPPEPPPANVAAIEPDVRGATTVREQLRKHRNHAACASCHRRIDPPGFALEAFDVIGGFRDRYRSIGEGDEPQRGSIDPLIGISFKLGPVVDSRGQLADGREFENIREYQALVARDTRRLLTALTRQLAVYASGRTPRFSDRPELEAIVTRTQQQGGGIRTLLHELVAIPLFTGDSEIPSPSGLQALYPTQDRSNIDPEAANRFLMTQTLPAVVNPARPPQPDSPLEVARSKYSFNARDTVRMRVIGLFMEERQEAFRELMQEIPEAELLSVEFETAEAVVRFAADSDLFRKATREQVQERLENRVRQASRGLFQLRAIGELRHDELERLEFTIVGLDCKACSLAVHDILIRIDGVEHATASFRDRRAIAWIDPGRTDRATIEAALKQRQVTLSPEP